MPTVRHEIERLHRRLRFQTLATLGAMTALVFALGGADAVARGLAEIDAWRVRTRKVDGTIVDRLVVGTDADQATIKVTRANLVLDSAAGAEANLKLAEQGSPPASPAAGMLWYDSTAGVHRLKYYNGTTWVDASGGGGAAVVPGTMQARLEIANGSTSHTTLQLKPYAGSLVEVNGELVDVAASTRTLHTGDPRVGPAGDPLGSGLSTNTLYYVYLSNSQAGALALRLSASTTAPSLRNGVYYLGTTGNAANWRFIGWVRTDLTPAFVNSDTRRFVVNYYNRISLPLVINPRYNGTNNLTDSYTTTSTTWVEANGGSGSRGEFISNGEDAVTYTLAVDMAPAPSYGGKAGVGHDSVTTPIVTVHAPALGHNFSFATGHSTVLPAGYHYLSLLIANGPGQSSTFYADRQKIGTATTDARATHIAATIRG